MDNEEAQILCKRRKGYRKQKINTKNPPEMRNVIVNATLND